MEPKNEWDKIRESVFIRPQNLEDAEKEWEKAKGHIQSLITQTWNDGYRAQHTREIRITDDVVALVDDVDYEYLSQFKWYLKVQKTVRYAYRQEYHGLREDQSSIMKPVFMHRQITNAPPKKVVDHINGDGLDNRRANLRLCTQAQNVYNSKVPSHNTSGYKGVSYSKVNKKWRAAIKIKGKIKWLGLHTTKESAAEAYDKEAKKLFGEFAKTNESMGKSIK